MADKGITERSGRFRAEAYDNVTRRRVYKTFPTVTAARAWRRDMQVKIARGEARAVDPVLVKEAWLQWLELAKIGVVRSRGGEEYKPGVLHSYESCMNARTLEKLGHIKVGELRRAHVQRYIDELVADGLAPQTIRNTVTALRVLMKWCVRHELRADNPCDGLELPAGGTKRDRIAPPTEAIELLGALEDAKDRAIYATAFFAGLRRGELAALCWKNVDTMARTITVDKDLGNYDFRTQTFGPPKSKAGARTLGIPDLLVPYLQRLLDGPLAIRANTRDLVFGQTDGLPGSPWATGVPFSPRMLAKRARAQWEGLDYIGLHEARHTYASLMIAAGVNIKAISEWMGHSSVTITLDRYGHLLPGATAEALGLLNAYLERELS